MEQLTQTDEDSRRDLVFAGADWTPSGQARIAAYERCYQQIRPYIEQTNRYMQGMRYRFSPEMLAVEDGQLAFLQQVGERVGRQWELQSGKPPLGFRIDFLQATDGRLLISEVQTDDRGLPEMAVIRNAYGESGLEGVVAGMVKAMGAAYPDARTMLFAYPDSEEFYYSAFPDLARLLNFEARAVQGLDLNFVVKPGSQLTDNNGGFRTGDYRNPEATADIVYDFSGKVSKSVNCVVQADKMFIRDLSGLARKGDPILAAAVPFTTMFDPPRIAYTAKENFVIKPVNGRWSRGLLIGNTTSESDWLRGLKEVELGNAVLQSYVEPAQIPFRVRSERQTTEKIDGRKQEVTAVSYPVERLYTRVEAYYAFDGGYSLADVMVTARPGYPVKGMRDCIMVPGKLA